MSRRAAVAVLFACCVLSQLAAAAAASAAASTSPTAAESTLSGSFRPPNCDWLMGSLEFLMTRNLRYPSTPLSYEEDVVVTPPKGKPTKTKRLVPAHEVTVASLVDVASHRWGTPSSQAMAARIIADEENDDKKKSHGRRLLQASTTVSGSPWPACAVQSMVDSYTPRDWERWDGWSSAYSFATVPRLIPSLTSDRGRYRSIAMHTLASEPFASLYALYRSAASGGSNYFEDLTQRNFLGISNVMLNVSAAINLAYNTKRCNRVQQYASKIRSEAKKPKPSEAEVERQALAKFDDDDVDFLRLPGVNQTAQWLEKYLRTFFGVQATAHGAAPGQDFDAFGFFANRDSFGAGYDRRNHFFSAAAIARLMSHYLHFMTTDFLIFIRPRLRYTLSALLVQEDALQPGEHSAAQWLLDIEAWSQTTYCLKQSERLLRLRGAWQDSFESTTTDSPSGEWKTVDALQHAEDKLTHFASKITTFGVTEFRSDYYNVNFLCLGSMMQHAPSQTMFDLAQSMYLRFWADLAAHFTPFSGSLSAPTARAYDLFDGTHAALDGFDLPYSIDIMFRPYCAASWLRQLQSSPTVNTSITVSCPNDGSGNPVPVTLPPSAHPQLDVPRLMFLTYQLAGFSTTVRDTFQAGNINTPRRMVEQRYSSLKGQERVNFVWSVTTASGTTGVELGHAGEDGFDQSDSIYHTARLPGLARPGLPVLSSGAGTSVDVGLVRLMAETSDSPFRSIGGQLGEGLQVRSRSVTAQYQHLMLITQLLGPQSAGGSNSRASDPQSCWNTNLLLPLAVDGIYADDSLLPTAVGSNYVIPLDAVMTAQHFGACFGARLVSSERSDASPMVNASVVADAASLGINASLLAPGVGQQPYSLMWQVDSFSTAVGLGRFTVHHKHQGTDDQNLRSFRVAWLWAVEPNCASASARVAFQATLRSAAVIETFEADGAWPPQQPPDQAPPPFPWYWGDPVAAMRWTVTAQVQGHTLQVVRKDVYQPQRFAPIYTTPPDSPLNTSPYWLEELTRSVDGQEQFLFAADEDSQRVTAL